MPDGYIYGPVSCRLCFHSAEQTLALRDWRLRNNPGYYGSSDPEILILVFSKGANQNRASDQGNFDEIAFAGARQRLKTVLETLKIMPSDRSIDDLMTGYEKQFGVASLVRCGLGKMKDGMCKTSGDVIPSAFTNAPTLSVIQRCARAFLKKLPERIKLVVLLGTGDNYISKTQSLFSELYPDYSSVNPVAFRADGALWVYAAHPSPGNGHLGSWAAAGMDNPSGRKRILALQALENA